MGISNFVGAVISMIFATSSGEILIGYVDTFINQIAVLAIVFECILYAWIFKAERLIEFLNARSKTIKIGKWWIAIVKYILPIVISVIWIGGLMEIMRNGTFEQLIVTVILAAILLVSCLIFTILPAKDPDWDKIDERV